MASFTNQLCWNVIQTLANGNGSIVTTIATTNRLSVIHSHCWHPNHVGVAVLTQVRGINMHSVLTTSSYPVVTGNTGSSNTGVIKSHVSPVRGDVAGIARFDGDDVRRPFTDSNGAIVATFTGANDLRVIHRRHRQPTG